MPSFFSFNIAAKVHGTKELISLDLMYLPQYLLSTIKNRGNQSKLVLDHPVRGGYLYLFNLFFPAYQKTNGGWEYWDVSYAVVPNIDSDKYRNPDFRRRMLLPTDKRPTDNNVYCIEPCGEHYAVIPKLTWHRLRGKLRKGNPPPFVWRLNSFLDMHRGSGALHIEENAVTIGLVDVLGKYWGKYMRSSEINSLVPCTLAAILKEKKLGIHGHGFKRNNHYYRIVDTKKIPIKGMSRTQLDFHRAWIILPQQFKTALWMHYVPEANQKALEMSADGYRFLIDDAHEAIMRIIIAQAEPNE